MVQDIELGRTYAGFGRSAWRPATNHGEELIVKSASRAIEILEYLDLRREGVKLGQVAEALNYPLSSTSALLRTLESIGYLRFDRIARTYMLTQRVSLLGAWLDPQIVQKGRLLRQLETIADRLGQICTIAVRNQFYVEYLHVVTPRTLQVAPGTAVTPFFRQLITANAAGMAILSGLTDEEIGKLILRANAEFGAEISDRKHYVRGLRSAAAHGIFQSTSLLKGHVSYARRLDSGEGSFAVSVECRADQAETHKDGISAALQHEIGKGLPT